MQDFPEPSDVPVPRQLDLRRDELLDELEEMDDAVWKAVQGEEAALRKMPELWRQVSRELPPDLVEESREQYLRYAVRKWKRDLHSGGAVDERTLMATLDILSFFLEPESSDA